MSSKKVAIVWLKFRLSVINKSLPAKMCYSFFGGRAKSRPVSTPLDLRKECNYSGIPKLQSIAFTYSLVARHLTRK